MASGKEDAKEMPERAAFTKHRQEQLAASSIEAVVLERNGAAIRYRALSDKEARDLIGD